MKQHLSLNRSPFAFFAALTLLGGCSDGGAGTNGTMLGGGGVDTSATTNTAGASGTMISGTVAAAGAASGAVAGVGGGSTADVGTGGTTTSDMTSGVATAGAAAIGVGMGGMTSGVMLGGGAGGAGTAGSGAIGIGMGGMMTSGGTGGAAIAGAGTMGMGMAGMMTDVGTAGAASGGSGAGGAGGSMIEPSLATLELVIMSLGCAGSDCHGGNEFNPLDLRLNDDLYTNLTMSVSMKCENLPIVDPGNPEGSALVRLLNGPCGEIQRMPAGCTPGEGGGCVPDDYIAAIEQWIANGAPQE